MVKKQLTWETKKVKVSELIPWEKNPRKITEAQKDRLVKSLKLFDLVDIPVVNTDLKIIGGNQRVSALMLMGRGEESVDVRVPSRRLTEKEVKEYSLTSNTHAGEFDFDILASEFLDVDLSYFGLTGFDVTQNVEDVEDKENIKKDLSDSLENRFFV